MRIGIDATPALVYPRTGVETYAFELVRTLINEVHSHGDLQLYLYFHLANRFVRPSLLDELYLSGEQVHRRVYQFRRGYGLILPLWAKWDGLNLLHMLLPRMPSTKSCATVFTVHDLVWAHLAGEEERREEHADSEDSFRRTIASGDYFIADSRSTAWDLNHMCGIGPDKIQVVHLGADHIHAGDRFDDNNSSAPMVKGTYILYLGTIQYRKNLVRLAQAFCILRRRYSIPHKLVLAGSNGNGHEMIYKAINDLDHDDSILFLGYVSDAERQALYRGASLFVFPSLYEGFGFPVIEALSNGVSVVTSGTSSLPEVGGDLVLYCDPLSVEDIAKKMGTGLLDETQRARVREEGPVWARNFSWQRTAQETLSVYRYFVQHHRK